MTDTAQLHAIARGEARLLISPDKKQLSLNDIVTVALSHYPSDPIGGIRELVQSCGRLRVYSYDETGCDLVANEGYVKGAPMWEVLQKNYAWMVEK